MACPSDYRGLDKIKELKATCDKPAGDFTVKDMAEMTFQELRMLFKYADLLHDHCDGARTTVKNCAKNRYHLIPDELHSLVELEGAAAGGAVTSNIQIIQFLNAIHNSDKHLNTNDIEDSFSTLLSYAFPREFGGETVEIKLSDSPDIKLQKTAKNMRRASQLSHVYGTPSETVPVITVDDIYAGKYNIDALQDYNTLQLTVTHKITENQLSRVGAFIQAYYGTQYNGSPNTNYSVFCDSAPNIVKFMKNAPDSPFTQVYSAQTVLDSASSGRKLLSDTDVPMYASNGTGVEHVYTTYALTTATAGVKGPRGQKERSNNVASIKTRAVLEGGAEQIIIETTLTNIGTPIVITERLYVKGGGPVPRGAKAISTGPTLPFIAKLNDVLSDSRTITGDVVKSAITTACDNCDSTMWSMIETLVEFANSYNQRRMSPEKLKTDILDYINDWKGFGDAEMVLVAVQYPVVDGAKKMFVTGDRVSAMFGRFAGLPTAMSNTQHEHIMYRPVIQQNAGGRVLSELKLVLERLQTYNTIVKNYIAHNVYLQHLDILKDVTDDTHESYVLLQNNMPPYIYHPLRAKIADLHMYVKSIVGDIEMMKDPSRHGPIPIIPALTTTSQVVFDNKLSSFVESYRNYNEEQITTNVFPISEILLTAYKRLIPDMTDHVNTLLEHAPSRILNFPPTGRGRKRTIPGPLKVHFISLPELIELIKVYLEHIATIMPVLITITDKLQRITRLQIMQRRADVAVRPDVFVKKLHMLKTKIKSGSYFELNAALKLGPQEFANVVLARDFIFKQAVKADTINNRHPFIEALRAIRKTFCIKENRDAYDDFIVGPFTDSLHNSIESIITNNPGVRAGRELNTLIEREFNTIVRTAFGVSGGGSKTLFGEMSNLEEEGRPAGNSAQRTPESSGRAPPGASLETTSEYYEEPQSPGGSRRQIDTLLEVMNEFIMDFYDTSTITGDELITMQIEEIEVPVGPAVIDSPTEVRMDISSGNPELDIYIASVVSRVGFSEDSYVLPDELIEMCRAVFESPYISENDGDARPPGISPIINGDTIMPADDATRGPIKVGIKRKFSQINTGAMDNGDMGNGTMDNGTKQPNAKRLRMNYLVKGGLLVSTNRIKTRRAKRGK